MSKFAAAMGLELEPDLPNALKLSELLLKTATLSDETPLKLDYLWVSSIDLRCIGRTGISFWIEFQSRNMHRSIFTLGSLRRRTIQGQDQQLVALKQSGFDDRFYKIPIIGYDHDDTGLHLLADNS